MDKYSDLAPWILGGLSAAAVAVAITLSANNRTAPSTLPAPGASTTERLPAAAAINPPPPLAAAQLSPAVPPASEAVVSQPVNPAMQPTQPAAAAAQIWECTTNGQRTFSNNPCGEKSLLRTFGPINTMDATPVPRYSHSYQPEQGYAPAYAQDYGNSGTQDYADDSFQVPVGIAYFGHRRGDRIYRPYQHGHGPAPRRN